MYKGRQVATRARQKRAPEANVRSRLSGLCGVWTAAIRGYRRNVESVDFTRWKL